MPHLSPIYWISTFFMFNFILLLVISLLSWQVPLSFPGMGAGVDSSGINRVWDWS